MVVVGMNNVSPTKLYQAVAEVLRGSHDYVTVVEIADRIGVPVVKVRNSITRARLWLAKDGLVVINKLGHGYRLGTPDEFIREADKASKRAFGHLSSAAKVIAVLRASSFKGDIDGLRQTIINNLSGITVLFDAPRREDFDSVDEWLGALESHTADGHNQLVPPEVRDDPETIL